MPVLMLGTLVGSVVTKAANQAANQYLGSPASKDCESLLETLFQIPFEGNLLIPEDDWLDCLDRLLLMAHPADPDPDLGKFLRLVYPNDPQEPTWDEEIFWGRRVSPEPRGPVPVIKTSLEMARTVLSPLANSALRNATLRYNQLKTTDSYMRFQNWLTRFSTPPRLAFLCASTIVSFYRRKACRIFHGSQLEMFLLEHKQQLLTFLLFPSSILFPLVYCLLH